MKILAVSHHHAIASSRYLTNAFIRLGHDVKHIGEPTPYFGVNEHPERMGQSQRWVQPHTYDARAQTIIETLIERGIVQ